MSENINHQVRNLTQPTKNKSILDDTKRNLVDCTFSNETDARKAILMDSIKKNVQQMNIYPEDDMLYYKTMVNILMELTLNNLKHNILSQEHPANLTIQKEGNQFIIKISIIGTKAKQMKLSNSIALSELSQEDSRKEHINILFNNKDVDENGCGGMGHKVTVRRVKRIFPDAKNIFHISDPIELDNDLVKSDLTVKVPVLKQESIAQEKTPEYIEY